MVKIDYYGIPFIIQKEGDEEKIKISGMSFISDSDEEDDNEDNKDKTSTESGTEKKYSQSEINNLSNNVSIWIFGQYPDNKSAYCKAVFASPIK